MQPVLEQSSIDKPLTFDIGLIQLSFIPVCSPNIYMQYFSQIAQRVCTLVLLLLLLLVYYYYFIIIIIIIISYCYILIYIIICIGGTHTCIINMFMVQDNIIIILVVISINLCTHVLFYFLFLLRMIVSAESLARGSRGLDSAKLWHTALLQVLFALYRAEGRALFQLKVL